MIAARERVRVFAAAKLAHLKLPHRGICTVVRQRGDDAKARAAIGAVDKRIVEARILRVVKLFFALIADRKIGQDRVKFTPLFGLRDLKISKISRKILCINICANNPIDSAKRRRLAAKALLENF